jgi:large subunit ribosomal protein L25
VSAASVVLKATSRTEMGKSVAHLRKAGKVPGVVFGHGLDSIAVSIEAHEFEQLRRKVHANSIMSLEIDGKTHGRVMVHGFQIDPRSRQLLHVDLFMVKSGEEVTVEIPLRTTGEAYAATKLGGTLLHAVDRVRVRALPENLPEALEISVEPLKDFDVSIHLRDVPLPQGVTLMADLDEVVVKVLPPHVVEEAAPAAEVPTEEEAATPAEEAKPES